MSKNIYAGHAFICTDIAWDTDGEDINLPTEMSVFLGDEINDSEIIEELLRDYLSDTMGFCHYGFDWETVDFNDAVQVARYNALKR